MAIVIIADDLSGAAELAGIAFAHGYSAEVQRRFDPSSDAEIIAIDTHTRSLAPDQAAAQVAAVAHEVVASRPDWIFKKTDSVLRGHPAAEIEAILSATGLARSVFVPANPSRGRAIVRGVYWVNGVPLDQTAFAADPEFLRRSGVVNELLGVAPKVNVPDVADSTELARIADAIDESTLPAGAADFFTALLAKRGSRHSPSDAVEFTLELPPPRLLVCGSRVAWPLRLAQAKSAGIPAVELSQVLSLAGKNVSTLAIGIGESPPNAAPAELLSRLAQLAAQLMHERSFATVLVEGGATAAALAQQLSWTRFGVCGTAPAGVGMLRPLRPPNSPLLLVKPGSYDWPPAVWCRFSS